MSMTDENNLYKELKKVSFTKADLNNRLNLLRSYLENRFFAKKSKPLVVFLQNPEINPEDSLAIKKLSKNFFAAFDKNNAYSLLSTIEKTAEKDEVLKVYLPVEFTGKEKDKVASWFKDNLAVDYIIDIEVDPSLTLGFSFASKGVYHDFSLKYFVNKLRPQIKSILERYVGQNN